MFGSFTLACALNDKVTSATVVRNCFSIYKMIWFLVAKIDNLFQLEEEKGREVLD
jgi:hypothetical protein